MEQVITINPDGSIEGLQRKKGDGVDLRQFGKAQIKRVSEILWDEDEQKWFISILYNNPAFVKGTGAFLDLAALQAVKCDFLFDGVRELDGALLFDDYDDAVRAEVAYLDWCRLHGKDPRGFTE